MKYTRYAGTPISGGSVLNGQVQDAEEALALHFTMKIQFLASHTITLPVHRHYDNSNQVASFYKLPLSISIIMVSESFMN
jgi:hypothetical protein